MTAVPLDAGEVAGGFEALLGKHAHAVIAVSGGADSTALMHLLAAWREGTRRAAPLLSVATVDHGLRPESAAEAAAVAAAAKRLGLAHATLRWLGPHPGTGVQSAAREARYRLLVDHARALGADCIALAHTADDQAETLLMRLARGSGIEGLSAMRAETTREGVTLVRPLLAFPKARLMATLRAGDHAWLEDPSNADERFERVRVRAFLAQAADIGLTAGKIALSARRLADAEESLRVLHGARDRLGGVNRPADGEMISAVCADLPVSRLGGTAYVVARTLRQLIRLYGGAAREPELAQLEDLAGLLRDEHARRGCGGLTLGGCKIELLGEGHERIRVYREGAGAGIAPVPAEPGIVLEWDGGRFRIAVASDVPPGAMVETLGMTRWAWLRRALPELETLRWPAAAAATLPVIVRGEAVAAWPALAVAAPREAALSAAWRAFDPPSEPGFQAFFRDVPAW